MDLAVAVPDLDNEFPRDYRWLASQMMRSSESVPSNIAEGFERRLNGDFVRVQRIAKASLGETDSHMIYALRRGLVDKEQHDKYAAEALRVRKMLSRLIAYLTKRQKE